jgi:hypothetical protein
MATGSITAGCVEHDAIVVHNRPRRNEAALTCIDNFEVRERLSVAAHESAAGRIEKNAESRAFDLHRPEHRSGCNQFRLAIDVAAGKQSESATDFTLVARMDVSLVAEIVYH